MPDDNEQSQSHLKVIICEDDGEAVIVLGR